MLTTLIIACSFAQPVVLDPEPRWWKGNIHTHTFWSDGNDFPEMVAEWYRDHDYNFLALSDHNTLSEGIRWVPIADIDRRSRGSALPAYLARFGETWVEQRANPDTGAPEVRLKPFNEYRALVEERNMFIMMQGEEITDSFDGNPVHLNASNLTEFIAPQGGDSLVDVMRRNVLALIEQTYKTGTPAIIHLNHPNFGFAVNAEDIAEVVEERYFEVFNGHAAVHNLGDGIRPGTEEMWDIVNTLRLTTLDASPLFGIGSDDSHSYHDHSIVSVPGRAWIMVRATHLTPEALIRAMEAGDFYATSGVTLKRIEFDATTRTLQIDIDPEPGVTYITEFIGTRHGVSLESEPRRDANGSKLLTTRMYDGAIGAVLARSTGLTASYQLSGDELYVRAVITADIPPERPGSESKLKKAWTQPIGWRHE